MNRQDLQREAVLAAEYVLAEAGIAPGDRVPVFDLIEDRGIWLSFEPGLDRLLGVYQRIGNASGIAINTARPMTLQRFTAAHELGHHELGHESHLDAEATISEPVHNPKEIQAQTFAGSLLMSELTVETLLEHRGHRPDRPDLRATDVYLMSAELGVSYQAAVTQLRALLKISFAQAREFAKQSPARLKQELLGGRRPDSPRASVIQLTLADNRRELVLDVSDEIDVALPEMAASGLEWTLPTGNPMCLRCRQRPLPALQERPWRDAVRRHQNTPCHAQGSSPPAALASTSCRCVQTTRVKAPHRLPFAPSHVPRPRPKSGKASRPTNTTSS